MLGTTGLTGIGASITSTGSVTAETVSQAAEGEIRDEVDMLELVGYPKREGEDGKEAWALFYVDESVGSALELIDSALLVIDRR